MVMKNKVVSILFFIHIVSSYTASINPKPLPIGNFALPTALMPSPLFSLGQNIVDKGDVLEYVNPIFLSGKNEKRFFYNEIYTLIGLTNYLSVFFLIPAPVINRENGLKTTGFGDMIVQAEYAFYNKSAFDYAIQATAIASVYLPSGILEPVRSGFSQHAPFTGLGATGFFLGGTWSRTTPDWYSFVSGGGLLTTTHAQNKVGNSVAYQAGIGRNLGYRDNKILVALLEFDGITFKRDKLMGHTDIDSGGTVMYLGPSFYMATPHTIFQMGFQIPFYQKLNGNQAKNSFQISISFAWLMRSHEET